MSEIGHNSGGVAGEQLRAFVDRIENLNEEKDTLTADIREVYSEAKGSGFDTKVLRKIVALRKRDRDLVREENTIMALYADALGMGDIFS